MIREPIIMQEWTWQIVATSDRVNYKRWHLVWRGMVLGTVEAFHDAGPWYGNIGRGVQPLDYNYRTGAIDSLEVCFARVEEYTVRALVEGLSLP